MLLRPIWRWDWEVDEVASVSIPMARTLPEPMTVTMSSGNSVGTMVLVLKGHEKCLEAGLAIFSDMGHAVKTVNRLIEHYESARSPPS